MPKEKQFKLQQQTNKQDAMSRLVEQRNRTNKRLNSRTDPNATVDVDYVDQYLRDHDDYWSGYGSGKNMKYSPEYRLDERRAAIDSWLSGSLADGTIDQEWYDQVSGLLSQADSSVGMYQGQRDAGAYMNDWRDWYNQSADALDGMDWSTGRGGSAFIDDAMAGFADRDAATRAWLEENRAMLGEEYYKSMLEELDSYGGYADELRAAYDRSAEYFNQWDSQDAFDRQNYLEDLNVDAMKAGLEALKTAYDDMYVLEGPYGLLANDLLSEEDRARHTMRYEDIQQAYGANSEEILAKIEELEKDIRDAEKLQGGIAQAQKISGIEAKYSGMSYQDMMAAMGTVTDPVEKAWLEQNAPAAMTTADYDAEIADLDSKTGYLNEYIKVLRTRSEELADPEFVALQYGSDEDRKKYDTLMRELETVQDQLISAEDEYDKLMSRKWQLEQDRNYVGLDANADYNANSTADEEMMGSDQLYRYINSRGGELSPFIREDHKKEDYDWIEKNVARYSKYTMMTDAEIEDLNYIYRTQGKQAASDYISWLSPTLDKRAMGDLREDMAEMTENAPGWANALSVPVMLSGGIGYLDIATQNLAKKLTGSYQPINYYSTNMIPVVGAQAIRGTTAAMITDEFGVIDLDPEDHPYLAPILNGRGLADVYQLGMSAIDSKVAALTGNPVLATTLLASSAATNGVLDALERGATDEQALAMGLWNGAFEALFEFWEVNELLKGKPSWVKAAVNQAITEGVGEGATSLANNIADAIIMADKSAIAQAEQEYIAQGMDPEEAKDKAFWDAVIDIGWDIVGGAASGAMSVGGMAAGSAVANRVQYAALPKTVKNSVERLQGFGMDKGAATDISIALYQGAEGYGDQAAAYMAAFDPKQDPYTYASDFRQAYEIGKNNGNREYLSKLSLNEDQRKIAYELGAAASRKAAQEAKAPEKSESDEDLTYSVSNEGTTIDSTGKAVKVKGFASVGDKAVLELEDGKTIDAKEVSFGTEDEAVLYETVAQVSGSAETANRIMKSYSSVAGEISASDFAAGLRQAYDLGVSGQVAERQLGTYELSGKLPAAVRSAAFNRGKTVGDYTARQAELEARGRQVKGQRQGQLHFDRKGRTFDSKRESSLKAMEALSKAIGVNSYVYESYVENGKRVYQDRTWAVESAPNGFYDKDGIHIDLNAGNFGQGTMMFTVAHELTHFIKEWSPVKFRKLADILVNRYAEQGTSVRELIDRQIAKARENGREIDRDTAFEEVVADSMETMLTQGDIGDFMAQLKQKDKTLRDKIREWFRNLADSLKAVADEYRGAKPESPEGRLVAQMDDFVQVLQQAYAEALVDAGENYRANNKKADSEKQSARSRAEMTQEQQEAVTDLDVTVDTNTESVAPAVLYSERTWTESEYVQERDKAALAISKAIDVTPEKAAQYIDDINSIAKMIAEDRSRLDYFSSPNRSSFVGNVEYGGSFDFSTLCKKRRLLTGTFTAIQKALPNTALTANEILEIRDRMKKAGLEVSCGLCYVEGSRANMGQFAKEFLRLYKQYHPDAWQPNMADVNTPEGIEWVRINHPECYEQYEYFWNHYGTLKPGDKNLFASQQKPKLYQLHTEYKGEILQKFNEDNVEDKNLNGGIRLQSFSDFEIVHLIDTMQIIMDMSRVGLNGQAYTKVPDFAWALGDTGLKINLSLIAKGVDENGKLIFDDVEGMPINEAMRLRERYSENVGTILVAFNDQQLMAAMADDRVDFIIPFHRSQWKKSQYEAMGLPAKTKDYTFMQNEKFIKPQYHEYRGRMVKDKATNYMPNEYWDFSKSGKENAEAYLELCARNNKRPKFYKLLTDNKDGSYSLKADGSTDGYWKLLIDFKMYDNQGNGSPQRPVRPDFNMKEANRMLEDYKGGHSSFPVAQGIVDKFVAEYKDSHKGQLFSDRDAGAEKVAAALERQNAKLKQDVKDLRELLSMQGKLTHGSEFTKSSIEKAMRSLIKAAGARLNADDRLKMAGMLKDLYRYIAGDKELTWDGVEERAGAIADLLMNNVNIKAQRDSYADEILGYLRGTKIKLSDSQRAEVEKLYGYENYRKMLFGAKVYIGRNGIDLDSLWHEASRPDMFGGTFKDDVNEGDQPAALLDIIENMREGDDSAAMEYAYNWESIRQGLIQSIYDRYWQLETLETVADKKKAQMDKLREDHRKLMDEIREDQKYTLEKLRTIRENVLYTVRTDYEKGSYAPVKLIADSWKTDRKRALGEFRQIEDTFIQIAKDFERFGQQRIKERAKDQRGFEKQREQDRKQFEKELEKEAAKHDKDNALWTREFDRLLKEYDKSGRKIERLEERYKTREENLATGKQRAAVEKAAKSLMNMLSKPSKEAHVPMALQAPLEKFLNSIDFSSKRALSGGELTIRDVAYTRALLDVKLAIAAQRTALEGNGDGTFSLDVPKEFLDQIDAHIKMIQDATEGLDLTANRVYEMTSDKLKDLAFILKTINKAIRDIDRLHMAGAKARVSELAKSTVWEMGRRKAVKTEDGGAAMWANYTPTFAFERMGQAATQILNGLKMGQAKLARTAAAVIKFSNETYTNKEVKAWENEVHEVELDSGETVKMTTAQIMSFYCLSRREQAKGHLTGGGIRMGNIGEGRKTVRQTDHFRLTQNDIAKINGLLTDRQIAVANKMQRYMADVGGRLGNEISMARWDYMEMTDRDYFPIRSDSDIHDARNPDQDKTNLWALLNKSFTKQVTKGANDAMIVSSIFDVFADHMSDMAEYNAFALPLVDAMKWYNYRESTKYESGHVKTVGVKKALTDKLGTAAAKYFIDLMTDINSSQKAGRYENFFGKLLSRSKAASVGWNLRVAIQQPTAILRASVYLDPMSLVKGTVKKGMKASIEEMKKYSGIALWKSLGYYDLNISRGIRDQIKGDTTVLDQINDAGMWLPGKMDEVTWSRIWESCKTQVVKEQKLSGERLLEETAKLFEDVVYHTQVADSVLTRSSLMRSKSQTVKELTSFMAEPTLSVNLLLNAFQDYREGASKSDKVKRTMKILFCGYVLSAMANAIFTAFADAFRDDDEYEGYWDKFFQALLGEKFYDGNLFAELNPLEKIVFVRDVLSLLQGYEGTKNPFVELAESGIKLVQNIAKFFQGKGSLTAYGLIYQSLQVLGGFTGAAPANLLREASTIWNWTFGKWNNMPLHRYKTDPQSQIRDAYKSGALKKSEAREALMAAGISVTDAYYIIKGWDAGESVGRYDDVYKAALAGDDISAAVAELVEHGDKTEKEVLSQLKSQIGTWYTDPESDTKIDRQEAEMMLRQYFDLDDKEIEEQLLLWDMKVDTGFSLDGLKQKFLDEAVSAEDAVRYLMEYGGKDQEDAQERVDDWAFELEHGYSYDDIKFTYLDNQITAQEARDVLVGRLGKTEAEADLRIQYWEYLRYHRDSKLTEYQVADYYEYAEPAEITADVYERYIEGVKGIEGQGTKVRKMAVIDQLPLTDEQKDALYFANDWAKSTLHEAPWHLTQ